MRIRVPSRMDASKLSIWREVILELAEKGYIRSENVKKIMMTVDRRYYVPCAFDPYEDSEFPIGYGATISAPNIHAQTLELLKDKLLPGTRALDVCSGSGYLSACMGFMVGPSGLVIGIENIANLVQLSKNNVLQGNSVLIDWNSVIFEEADGRLGYPAFAPYDAINVGTATQNIPSLLMEQLAPGGRLVIPLGSLRSHQFLTQVDKRLDGYIVKKKILRVKFVPLTDRTTQK